MLKRLAGLLAGWLLSLKACMPRECLQQRTQCKAVAALLHKPCGLC